MSHGNGDSRVGREYGPPEQAWTEGCGFAEPTVFFFVFCILYF